MANRILLGKEGSNYVLKVSEPTDNVLSPSEPLIYDSTAARTGEVYAGGFQSSTDGVDWSATKGTLGFIPLIISTDDQSGNQEIQDTSTIGEYIDRAGAYYVTTTRIEYETVDGDRTATNARFIVLRCPCQYGNMTTASLWD